MTPSERSRPWGHGAALLLGAYAAADAWLFYVGPAQRIAYAVLGIFVVSGVIVGIVRDRPAGFAAHLPTALRAIAVAWLAVAVIACVPAITELAEGDRHLAHVVGDLASSLLPLLFLLFGAVHPEALRGHGPLLILAVGLGLAALAGMVSPVDAEGRHAAPVVLALALGWTTCARMRGALAWRAAAPYLALFLIAAVLSGYRSSLVLWPGLGLAVWALAGGPRRVPLMVAIGVAGVAGWLTWEARAGGDDALESLRLEELAQDGSDPSLETRVREAQDVLRVAREEWGPVRWILGAGHGALLTPVHATPNPRNLDAEGRFHTVHVTPVLVFFRYGLIGVLAMAALAALLAHRLFVLARDLRGAGPGPSLPRVLFPLAMLAYAADSLVHVALVDPAFSYALAGFLYFEVTPERPAAA